MVKQLRCLALSILLVFAAVTPSTAAEVSDAYLLGYVTAILERNSEASGAVVEVNNGIIYIRQLAVSDVKRDRIRSSLANIEGVKDVRLVSPGEASLEQSALATSRAAEEATVTPQESTLLAEDLLFRSLLADPRWPHFSASYLRFLNDDQLTSVGSANFGEMFSIYRFAGPGTSKMELGIQAGVFSIFDLDAESLDLVNADYFVAIPLSFRRDKFSAMFRLFHQSSHLGDDLQTAEESDWSLDVSLRTGIQLEDAALLGRKMQVLLEYYNGKSPNGQFYQRTIETVGLGLHFFYD